MDWISRNKQTEQVQYMLKNEVLLGGKGRQLLIFRSLMQTVIRWKGSATPDRFTLVQPEHVNILRKGSGAVLLLQHLTHRIHVLLGQSVYISSNILRQSVYISSNILRQRVYISSNILRLLEACI
jgi:hypothetical protein